MIILRQIPSRKLLKGVCYLPNFLQTGVFRCRLLKGNCSHIITEPLFECVRTALGRLSISDDASNVSPVMQTLIRCPFLYSL